MTKWTILVWRIPIFTIRSWLLRRQEGLKWACRSVLLLDGLWKSTPARPGQGTLLALCNSRCRDETGGGGGGGRDQTGGGGRDETGGGARDQTGGGGAAIRSGLWWCTEDSVPSNHWWLHGDGEGRQDNTTMDLSHTIIDQKWSMTAYSRGIGFLV